VKPKAIFSYPPILTYSKESKGTVKGEGG